MIEDTRRIAFDPQQTVVAICGGVGGAKLALGLQHVLGKRLTVIVNVGDDFDHLGLRICPDLDTVLYTLGGLSDEARGWGRAGESWNFMDAIKQLDGESWFALGDRDLALHVERTRRLAAGETLTEVIASVAQHFGIAARLLPVTDDRLRTKVDTEIGTLDFQHYFVKHRCEPALRALSFSGAAAAGKSRLSYVLRPDERRALNWWLLNNTLDKVAALERESRIYVVSPSDEVIHEAKRRGYEGCREGGNSGLNGALASATQQALDDGADGVLVLPVDLTRLSANHLHQIMDGGLVDRDVLIVTDRCGSGTNLMLWRPLNQIAFRYGPESARRHAEAASELGLRFQVQQDPDLSFDLDSPLDWLHWSLSCKTYLPSR